MSWNSVIGQFRAKEILHRSIVQNRVAHAYLLWGPRGTGKDALAIEFAKTLLCERQGTEACDTCASCRKVFNLQHPNLRIIFALPAGATDKSVGEGKQQSEIREEIQSQIEQKAKNPYFHFEIPKATQINIGSIREVRKESSLSAFEKGRKVFIISDADMMNDASGNSLLKVLEEPLSDTLFLLTTARKEKLLPTIVSRCQSIRCELLSDREIEAALEEREKLPEDRARLVSRLANGDFSRALELLTSDLFAQRADAVGFLRATLGGRSMKVLENIEERLSAGDRNAVGQFLNILLVWFRDAMIMSEGGEEGVINQDQREDLARFIGRFGKSDFSASIGAVENALDLLRGNVYLPLVLLSLSVQLKRVLLDAKQV